MIEINKGDTFDSQVKRARRAIFKSTLTRKERVWLLHILFILRMRGYVRVLSKYGRLIDIEAVAYTSTYASFFDVYNHITWYDLDVWPVEIVKLENSYKPLEKND